MSKTGIIIEIKKDKSTVMTGDMGFYVLKRSPLMVCGQRITFDEKDLYRYTALKRNLFAALSIASAAAIIMIVFILSSINAGTKIYAYIDVDINPSIELAVDNNNLIAEAVPLNKKAIVLLQKLKLKNLSVKDAISEIYQSSRVNCFIHEEDKNNILISGALNLMENRGSYSEREKKLDLLLSGLKNNQIKNVQAVVLKVSPEKRSEALKKGISMGRYVLYEKLLEKNKNYNINDLKNAGINEIIRISGMENPGSRGSSKLSPVNTNTIIPLNKTKTPAKLTTHGPLAVPSSIPQTPAKTRVPIKNTAPVLLPTKFIILPSPVPKPATPALKKGVNLIKNPGFESESAGWQTDWGNNSLSGQYVKTGSRSIAAGPGEGGVCQYGSSIIPGKQYFFSGWGKLSSQESNGYIFLSFFDKDGRVVGSHILDFRGCTGFTRKETTVVPPDRTVKFRVDVYKYKDPQSGLFYADDICISPVDP